MWKEKDAFNLRAVIKGKAGAAFGLQQDQPSCAPLKVYTKMLYKGMQEDVI